MDVLIVGGTVLFMMASGIFTFVVYGRYLDKQRRISDAMFLPNLHNHDDVLSEAVKFLTLTNSIEDEDVC